MFTDKDGDLNLYQEFSLVQEKLNTLNPYILKNLTDNQLEVIFDIKKITKEEYYKYWTDYGIKHCESINKEIEKFYKEITNNSEYLFKSLPSVSTGITEPQKIYPKGYEVQETMYSDKDNTLYIKPQKEVKHIECEFVFSRTDNNKIDVSLNEAKKNINSYLESAEFDLTMDKLMNERNKDNLDNYFKNEPKKSIENKNYTWHIDIGTNPSESNCVGLEYKEGKFKEVKSKPRNLDFDKGFELSFKNNEDISKKLNDWFALWHNLNKSQVNIPSQLVEVSKQIHITKDMTEYETDPIINFFKTPNLVKEYEFKIGDKVKCKKPLEFSVNNLGFECACLSQDSMLEIVEFIYNHNKTDNLIRCSYKGKNLPIHFKASDLELVEIAQDSIQAKKEYMNQEYEDFEGIILQDQNKPTSKEIFMI